MAQQLEAATLSDPSAAPAPGGTELQLVDTVTRQHICEGEALRAVAEYSLLDFATPPTPAVLSLLDVAYGHMRSIRPSATPEDFAVYVFSLLRECCIDSEEEDELKIAAARYIVDNTPQLSDDFAEFVPRAHALLASTGTRPGPVPAVAVPSMPGQIPAPEPLLLMVPDPRPSGPERGDGPDLRVLRGRAEAMNAAVERAAAKRAAILTFGTLSFMALVFLAYLAYAPAF